MPDITGGTGTGSVGTPAINRAVSLSGWFGQRRFANLSGVLGTHRVGYLSYLESGSHDWLLLDYADRLIDWTYCGVPGGIPTRTTIYQTMTPANTAAEITAAIAACPSGQVVKLSGGPYSLASVNFASKQGVTVRGDGPGVTTINLTGSTGFASDQRIFYEADGVAITSGYTKGSMSIVVSSGATFVAGNLIQITQDDSPDTFGAGIGVYHRTGYPGVYGMSATRNLRFTSRIESVAGTTVTLATPIPWTYSAALNPRAYPLRVGRSASLCGIEDMTIVGNGSSNRAVDFYGADRCWVYRVEARNFVADYGAIRFEHSHQCEIRRSYAHDCVGFPSQAEGYGFFLYYGNSYCLIEDNIAYHTAAAYLVNGSSCNAIINNYDSEVRRASQTYPSQSMMCNHGPHGVMNLFEGNITARFQNDGYHGSTSHQTLFRNHINGVRSDLVPTSTRRCVDLCRGSYYHTAVGNIIGDPSWTPTSYDFNTGIPTIRCMYILGFPGMDSVSMATYTSVPWDNWTKSILVPDADVAATLLRHGNHDYFNNAAVWDGGIASHDIPDSLFYSSKPSYFGSLAWPAIGPDVIGLVQNTPAKHRWDTYVISGTLSDLFADEA